jgi:hypothetical protein
MSLVVKMTLLKAAHYQIQVKDLIGVSPEISESKARIVKYAQKQIKVEIDMQENCLVPGRLSGATAVPKSGTTYHPEMGIPEAIAGKAPPVAMSDSKSHRTDIQDHQDVARGLMFKMIDRQTVIDTIVLTDVTRITGAGTHGELPQAETTILGGATIFLIED